MEKCIVITSIHSPSEPISAFSRIKDHALIVVGDQKTDADWKSPGCTYLSPQAQNRIRGKLIAQLPFNHYARKMAGYLYAVIQGADYIIDADDDIMPKAGWSFPDWQGNFPCVDRDMGFINIYQYFTEQHIWPRGLPLSNIRNDSDFLNQIQKTEARIGIWQGLSDQHPDVDAIYRLTDNADCYFNEPGPIVLGSGSLAPINSQNTAFRKALFPLLYLPVTTTFRFTDILRGWVAQPIMWLFNYHLGFTGANSIQNRNEHNYLDDFSSEIPMYQHGGTVPEMVGQVISGTYSLQDNLFRAYEMLAMAGIVKKSELEVLEAWLDDLAAC